MEYRDEALKMTNLSLHCSNYSTQICPCRNILSDLFLLLAEKLCSKVSIIRRLSSKDHINPLSGDHCL